MVTVSPIVRPYQFRHALHQPIDIDRFDLLRMLAGEREQALHQCGGALGGLARRIEQALNARIVIADPARGHVDIAEDHGEHVVEVVRDAARQPADRLHLLRLAERLLGRFAAADLLLQTFAAAKRDEAKDNERERRRQPEDQMAPHVAHPGARHGVGFDADRNIKIGQLLQSLVHEDTDAAVDSGRRRDQPGDRVDGDSLEERRIGRQALLAAGRFGIAHQHRAVAAQQCCDPGRRKLGIELAEILRRDRNDA